MVLLPYEHFEVRGKGPGPEVLRSLGSMVGPRRSWRRKGQCGSKPFEGTVNERTFRINPVVHTRTGFLPIIDGELVSEVPGVLRVRMRPAWPSLVFMIAWLVLTLAIGGVLIAEQLRTGRLDLTALLPPAMALVGYSLMLLGYNLEAGPAKAMLFALGRARRTTGSGQLHRQATPRTP